jgi:hypothetical protein
MSKPPQSQDVTEGYDPDFISLLDYINEGSTRINEVTSNRRRPTQKILDTIRELDRLYDNLPLTTKPFLAYRCYFSGSIPPYRQDAQGDLLTETFLSTSVSKNWLSLRPRFCNRDNFFMICIYVPEGSRAMPIIDHLGLNSHHHQMLFDYGIDLEADQIKTEYEVLLDQYGALRPTNELHRGVPVYHYISPPEHVRQERKLNLYRRLLEQIQRAGTRRRRRKSKRG